MARYRLTRRADSDFEAIFEFGIERFGLDQALAYQAGLKDQLAQIAQHPERYPKVSHLREGYRRSVFRSHAIYYHIDADGVVIVRILGQQDLGKAL